MKAEADVIVIGGGSTGTGIVRDLALRGVNPLLVEKNDLAAGATGACQGLLHSGGRYVVSDRQSARECYSENRILRKIAPSCVEETDGLFVSLPDDGLEYQQQFVRACEAIGIPFDVLSPEKAIALEPNLSRGVIGAVRVPDASINPFTLVFENAKAAANLGGTIMPHTRVTELIVQGERVKGVRAIRPQTGEILEVYSEFVINAAGAWAGEVVQTVGLSIPLLYAKGSILITSRRPTERVVNRCRPPSDGDIVVPNETTGLIGTTSIQVEGLDHLTIEPREVELLLDETAQMVPGLSSARIIRAFAGVRPLFQQFEVKDDRQVGRGFVVIDHDQRDGLMGLASIVGGKMATYRLMAEKVVDLVCEKLGITAECTTDREPLPSSQKRGFISLAERLKKIDPGKRRDPEKDSIICECELVTRREIEEAIMVEGASDLNDIRIQTRMGTGPCQGAFCVYKALGILAEMGKLDGSLNSEMLKNFLERRWRGIHPIVAGDQLKEEQLTQEIYAGVFNLDKEGLEAKDNV
ncbi:MAG: anaerobic glycerol-3-phosphate dehydrogenase subunit A [Proteobacteria bacterium]|nr:anaerobic glycerol-3-phosphate dehydrogenase subunit A [Pseudomonadota bacterium]NIS72344.1 anaerobic glycerol-3-phosphate dehydrogenase subunit A [Pseudomonadota bacterium]